MPSAVNRLVQTLRVASIRGDNSDATDLQLLEAFSAMGDEAAFTEVVRRHGSLVFGVCRRILGNVQDAEDAFQATFLVLARKAPQLAWRDCVKSWLHSVACRVALKARSQKQRRRAKEQAGAQPPVESPAANAWEELRAVLDEELQKLPAKYRTPLLLCYLEGKTRDEAAAALGWSIGSLKGRLERGRELLRDRLVKRGLTLSAALTTGLLAQAGAVAAPAPLTAATVQASLHFAAGSASPNVIAGSILNLAQGALNTMMIAKLKFAGMILISLTLLVAGTGWGVHHALADRVEPASRVERRQDAEIPTPVQFVALAQEKRDEAKKKDGRGEGERKRSDLLGIIKEIDLKIGTLTVTSLREDVRGDGKYSLADKNIKITTSLGKPAALSDLQTGQRIQAELKGEADIVSIILEHPQLIGNVSSIDAVKRVVELRAERQISTATVADDAKIVVNGKEVKLADFPTNERAFFTTSFDKKTILAMTIRTVGGPRGVKEGDRPAVRRPDGERPPAPRVPTLQGTIIDIDSAKNAVQFLSGRIEDQKIETMTLPAHTKVKVMFDERAVQEVTLAELKKPLQAVVVMTDDLKTPKSLSVNAPILRGAIKSVDVAAKKISVRLEGKELDLDVTADASIRVQGRDGKLADVRAGQGVLLGLSLDRQRVIGIITQERRGDGER